MIFVSQSFWAYFSGFYFLTRMHKHTHTHKIFSIWLTNQKSHLHGRQFNGASESSDAVVNVGCHFIHIDWNNSNNNKLEGKWTETQAKSHRHFNWHRHCLLKMESELWVKYTIRFVQQRKRERETLSFNFIHGQT